MTRLKLGLVTYGLDRPMMGISRYTVELARALSEMEASVDLTLLTAGEPRALEDSSNHRRESLPGCRLLPGLVLLGNVAIPVSNRRLRLEIVHDPTGVMPFLFGADGAKIVVTLHDVVPYISPGASTALDTLIYRSWLPLVIRRASAIITPSRQSCADISKYLRVAPGRICVISEGVGSPFRPLPRELVRSELKERFGLASRYIFYVGSLSPRKNLKRALQAFARVRKEFQDLVFVMAGPWSREQAVLPRLDGGDSVRLLGPVDDAELAMLYNGAELFFFPSLYEGFGLPALEAMACGSPVICSNTSAMPELVADAALRVNPYDVEAMAQALAQVLSAARLRESLREKGPARARGFTWKETAQATLDVYRQVLT